MTMTRDYAHVEPTRTAVDHMDGPTLLEFGNHWCGYCRAAQPLLEKAFAHHPRVDHIKIADASGRRLGRSFHVKLWPTFVFLRDGREVARLVRPRDAQAIRKALEEIDASAPTLVYLHGFRSSPLSRKAQLFMDAVARLPPSCRPLLHVPDLQHSPRLAVDSVSEWIARHVKSPADDLTLIGSSLGGYYATYLAERLGARAALINPAIRPCDDLRPYIGTQTNLYTNETFEVTEAHFAELFELKVARITRPERYFLLVRSGDEVLDWHEAVAFYGGAYQYVAGGGDHGWIDFDDEVPSILRFAGCSL